MSRKLPQTNLLLLPLAWVYGLVVWIRNLLFDIKVLPSRSFSVRLISVGNITVGGTGKTPHIEYILSLINGQVKAAVLSRGYNRRTRDFRLTEVHSTVRQVGDEPLQIKQQFPEVTVAVDRKRARGIMKLLAAGNIPSAILLDDAYQHRYVKPGLNILLIDYNRPLAADYLLPCGRLREPVGEQKRADIIVVSKCPENMNAMAKRIKINEVRPYPYQSIFFSSLHHLDPIPAFPGEAPEIDRNTCRKKNYGMLLVTGIANNRPLKRFLRSINPQISELRFPDHHYFTDSDLEKIGRNFGQLAAENKIIVTTAKDAVRLRETSLPPELRKAIYVVPVEVVFLFGEAALFNEIILHYVGKN